MRSWYENEELLGRFREWLGRTDREIYGLDLAEDARAPSIDAGETPDVSLRQLLEAFTAMRHELKLQTKSARGLEETFQQALTELDEAAEQMRAVEAAESVVAERAARPMVEALIDLEEALERGLRSVEKTHRQLVREARERHEQASRQRWQQLPWWQRLLAKFWYDASLAVFREQLDHLHQTKVQPLLEGFQLIYNRLQRTLQQLQIERIDCVGQPFDPAQMTVVELAESNEYPAETVLAVIRPGYLWQERCVRYAEVRAARSSVATEFNSSK